LFTKTLGSVWHGEGVGVSYLASSHQARTMNSVLHLPTLQRLPDRDDNDISRTQPRHFENHSGVYPLVKRGLDVVGAFTLGGALAPVMVVVAGLIKVSSPGPVIYTQRRLTEGGREFMLCKFRTMRHEAERESGAIIARLHDSRITPVGRFLRKTRLDELPQLVNVLRGEMSLIGPRPERPELARNFEKKIRGFHRRLRVKAGLTGLAQVIQGYPEYTDGYRQKLALDILYIKRRSLRLDAWIVLRTIGVVLSGSGAR
jgi:lipopolysaccharide/colanic/teichoic acid biosynthesis glycosyltransferase